MFFLTGLAKLALIAGMFFIIRRLAGSGVIFFIQGLATAYLGIVAAGIRRPRQDRPHGA